MQIMSSDGKEKFSIVECKDLAIKHDADGSLEFDICGTKGRKRAQWVDAHLGVLKVEGVDSPVLSMHLEEEGFWCENLTVPDPPEPDPTALGLDERYDENDWSPPDEAIWEWEANVVFDEDQLREARVRSNQLYILLISKGWIPPRKTE